MIDWGASNRVDSFEFVLCDPFTLEELAEPIKVNASESSLSWDKDSGNLYSGTIAALTPVTKDRLIKVRHTVEADGEMRTDTLATMFVEAAPVKALYGCEVRSASCYSTLFRLTQDKLDSDFSRPRYDPDNPDDPRAVVVNAIRDLVEEVGGRLVVADPEAAFTKRTFGKPINFWLGDNRMEVVRTIAKWIDCEIGCDPDGNVTISEVIDPADKPSVYTFEAGRNCTYLPGADVDDNSAALVNKVVGYFSRKKADDGFPLTDRAVVELGDESEFSFARCGRYQTAVIKVDPCSHETLVRKVKAHLRDNSGERRFYAIQHVSIPGLRVGDVVDYENDTDFAEPVKARCEIAQMDMDSMTPGALCTTKLRTI